MLHFRPLLTVSLFTVILWPTASTAGSDIQLGLRLPPDFEVTQFAGSDLANDIYTMTVDPEGRIVVAGRGYIRILVDKNDDGRADHAIPFADSPQDGAMGLLWEDDTLYVTGDGGLRVFKDADDDDRADGPAKLIRAMKTGREHGAHAIRGGPDGWLYVLCGNHAGIDKSYAQLPTSPIQIPIAGCVLRFCPDLKKSEIVAHGFRNPYGMDFNSEGELFTYDSDNERCVSLPWYEHTRFYHVIPGGFYGWLSPQHAEFWRCPPYFLDVVAPVTTLGRGSPTGVVCYRHVQFPEKYQGGMFALDWTFGKVYFLKLKRSGSSYTCDREIFIEAVGDNGFAPTAAVVHPQTGELFISIGGRGTRGAVYRVRYNKRKLVRQQDAKRLQPKKRSLDCQPSAKNRLLLQAGGNDKLKRLNALILLRRHAKHFTTDELESAILANWDSKDRYLRQAAADLLSSLRPESQKSIGGKAKTPHQQLTWCLSQYRQHPEEIVIRVRALLQEEIEAEIALDCVRLLQLAFGDLVSSKYRNHVWEGYSPTNPSRPLFQKDDRREMEALLATLRGMFPLGEADVDREVSRLFSVIVDDDPQTVVKVAARLKARADPVEQIHYLIVLSRLPSRRKQELCVQMAETLLQLKRKLESLQRHTDRHWPMRIRELYIELAKRYEDLNSVVLEQPGFGDPSHALFALCPGFDVKRAAKRFLKKGKEDEDFQWNADLLQIVSRLPEKESLPIARNLWGTAGLEAALLPILATNPVPQDRPKFVSGLKSPSFATLRISLQALKKLPGEACPKETLALLQALQRLPKDKAKSLREEIAVYLSNITGQNHGADLKAWIKWFSTAHPRLAEQLTNIDGVDLTAWKQRLAKLPLSQGDAKHGNAVYRQANCITCHSGRQALGPDLQGVGKRFSPQDLLLAIVQPSRDVPERYQTTFIETHEGKVYQGLVIYQATDSVILQTAAGATVRIPGEEVAVQQQMTSSLMPSGLLDNLSDAEIVDLLAYLRSL